MQNVCVCKHMQEAIAAPVVEAVVYYTIQHNSPSNGNVIPYIAAHGESVEVLERNSGWRGSALCMCNSCATFLFRRPARS